MTRPPDPEAGTGFSPATSGHPTLSRVIRVHAPGESLGFLGDTFRKHGRIQLPTIARHRNPKFATICTRALSTWRLTESCQLAGLSSEVDRAVCGMTSVLPSAPARASKCFRFFVAMT